MELGKELFDQIVAGLGAARAGGSQPQPRQPEQRSADRLAISAEVKITSHGVIAAKATPAKLRSLSRSGAAVLDGLARQAGDKIVLYLPKAGGEAIPIVCAVMNTRMSGGEFRLGVKFLSRAEQTGSVMLRGADGLVSRPTDPGSTEILDLIAEGKVPLAPLGPTIREQRVELNAQAMMSTYRDGH